MSLDFPQDQAPITPVTTGTSPSSDPVEDTSEAEVIQYLLVTDTSKEVLKSGEGGEGLSECRKLAGVIRRAKGEVTIYRSLKF